MPETTPHQKLAAATAAAIEAQTGKPLAKPQADFIGCLIPALLASVPTFLDAFLSCMAGGSSGYDPGDRNRCS